MALPPTMDATTRSVEAADREQIEAYARHLGVRHAPARRLPVEARVGGTVSGLLHGRAPRLAFLHGGQLNAHTWDGVILRVAAPAIAYDLPGHGHSLRLAPHDYDTRTVSSLVANRLLIDTEPETVLIGHSYGAMVAIMVAARLGPRIGTLLLLDATPHGAGTAADDPDTVHAGTLDELVDSVHVRAPQRSRESLLRGVTLNSLPRPDGLREWLWDPHFRATSAQRRGEREMLWNTLACLDMPITLVAGERSTKVSGEMVKEFRERVPRARVLVAPGAGHNVHNDAQAWTAELIRAHL